MKINFFSSVLLVQDINRSRQFYESVMNQKVDMDLGLNVSFGGFAIWQRDHAYEMIHRQSKPDTVQTRCEQFELYFESEFIDVVYENFNKSGYQFVHEIYEQPWGQKAFRVYDPDGYIVEVGEPMEALSRECFFWE